MSLSEENNLRPEANAVPYWALHQSQLDAVKRITEGLKECIRDISVHSALLREPGRRDPRADLYVDHFRSTRLIFLDGERGTGKSSVYLSLLHLIGPASTGARTPRPAGLGVPGTRGNWGSTSGAEPAWWDDVVSLSRQTIWLDPLDMEPLALGTNLITAVIARLLQAADRFLTGTGGDRGVIACLAKRRDSDPAGELLSIGSELAIAWEGHIAGRAAKVDLDTFAAEAIRLEQARLPVNVRFQQCLDELARAIAFQENLDEHLVFVLPIDDFDLNPTRALDLMRFLRMLSARRLFFLVLGDRELTEMVFALKVAGDMAAVIQHNRHREHISVAGEDIGGMTRQIAANAVRKLLPPHQVVRLRNLEITEAMAFKPWSGNEAAGARRETLGELLGKIRLDLTQDFQGIKTLRDFLGCSPAGPENFRYTGAGLFRAPLRHVTDLWFEFHRLVNRPADASSRESQPTIDLVAGVLAQHARAAILEDRRLTLRGREELHSSVNCDSQGGWELFTSGLRCEGTLTPGREISLDVRAGSRLRTSIFREWHLTTTAEGGAHPDDRTESALILLHDFHGLSKDNALLGQPLVPDPWVLEWTAVEWKAQTAQNVSVGWPLPDWSSFREFDLFQHYWQKVLLCPRETAGPNTRRTVTDLAYWWMRISHDLVFGAAPNGTAALSFDPSLHPQEADWAGLGRKVEHINETISSGSLQPGRPEYSWLVAVLSMLGPEAGVPYPAFPGKDVVASPWGVWPEPDLLHPNIQDSIRYRRARWLGRFMFFDAHALARCLYCVWTRELLEEVVEKLVRADPGLKSGLQKVLEKIRKNEKDGPEAESTLSKPSRHRRGRPRKAFPKGTASHPYLRDQVSLILDRPMEETDFEARLSPKFAGSILEDILASAAGRLGWLPNSILQLAVELARHPVNASRVLLPGSAELTFADEEADTLEPPRGFDRSSPFSVSVDWRLLQERLG